jgi:hypothetical protein
MNPPAPHINAHFTVSAFNFPFSPSMQPKAARSHMKRVRNVIVTVPVYM